MWRDLVLAWRGLARTPIVSAVIVASLAAGIGVNTAVFSWIEAFVLRPLPGVANAAELRLLEPRTEAGTNPGASWREYQDYAARLPSLRGLLAFRMAPFDVGDPAHAERAYGLLVSGNYFESLGLTAVLGRLLTPQDAVAPGQAPVAVVSHGYWQSHLGAALSAIGRPLVVNGRALTVIGVAPDGFQGTVLGLQFDLWVPATLAPLLTAGSRELDDRRSRGYTMMGRLADDRPVAQAEAARAAAALAAAYPDSNRGVGADVLPFWRAPRGPQGMLLNALGMLQGLMVLLLAAVCSNTATLLIARGAGRQRELGVRLAIGASRWQVVRLLLAESLVFAMLGAVAGATLAAWGTAALRAAPLTTALPIRFQTRVDVIGLLVALALGLLSAVACGLAPALRLGAAPGALAGRARSLSVKRAAMGIQVALAMVVLVIAGLFLRRVDDARRTSPGFDRDGVLLVAYDLAPRGADAAAARTFAGTLAARLRALPGVEQAAIAAAVPLDIHGLPERQFELEGRSRTDGILDRSPSNVVTPGYFAVMRIPFVSGEDFAALTDPSAPPQAIVNEAFVERYVGDGAVLGRRVSDGGRSYVIVGVVRTSMSQAFGEPPTPCLYFSYRDRPSRAGEIHVRTRPGAEGLQAAPIRAAVAALDAGLPLYNVRTLAAHVDTNLLLRRIPARLFLGLGPLLLVLAAVGIYAAVSHTVAARTADIGLRMALGAPAGRVVREVMADGLRVIGLGAAAGWLAVAVVYARLFHAGLDPVAFLAVPAVLLAVAAGASWLPARHAAAVDPAVALNRE